MDDYFVCLCFMHRPLIWFNIMCCNESSTTGKLMNGSRMWTMTFILLPSPPVVITYRIILMPVNWCVAMVPHFILILHTFCLYMYIRCHSLLQVSEVLDWYKGSRIRSFMDLIIYFSYTTFELKKSGFPFPPNRHQTLLISACENINIWES